MKEEEVDTRDAHGGFGGIGKGGSAGIGGGRSGKAPVRSAKAGKTFGSSGKGSGGGSGFKPSKSSSAPSKPSKPGAPVKAAKAVNGPSVAKAAVFKSTSKPSIPGGGVKPAKAKEPKIGGTKPPVSTPTSAKPSTPVVVAKPSAPAPTAPRVSTKKVGETTAKPSKPAVAAQPKEAPKAAPSKTVETAPRVSTKEAPASPAPKKQTAGAARTAITDETIRGKREITGEKVKKIQSGVKNKEQTTASSIQNQGKRTDASVNKLNEQANAIKQRTERANKDAVGKQVLTGHKVRGVAAEADRKEETKRTAEARTEAVKSRDARETVAHNTRQGKANVQKVSAEMKLASKIGKETNNLIKEKKAAADAPAKAAAKAKKEKQRAFDKKLGEKKNNIISTAIKQTVAHQRIDDAKKSAKSAVNKVAGAVVNATPGAPSSLGSVREGMRKGAAKTYTPDDDHHNFTGASSSKSTPYGGDKALFLRKRG